MVMSNRNEAHAYRSSITIKLYGTVGDSALLDIPPIAYYEDGPVSDRYLIGKDCYFTLYPDQYLGDIYRIEIYNSMNKIDNRHPSPDIFIDKIYIRNPDPVEHSTKTNVVSCFRIGEWINEKNKAYRYDVESGLDMESVKYMTEEIVYGTEFSIAPGDSKELEITEEYETEVSETVTTYRSTYKKDELKLKMKLTLFESIAFENSLTLTNEEKEEQTETNSEKENNKQVNTFKASITNDQARVRTFKEARISRKNYAIVMLGNLKEEGSFRRERIFAGFMETTPV